MQIGLDQRLHPEGSPLNLSADATLEEGPQVDRFAKLLKKQEPTISGEAHLSEYKLEFSGAFGHLSQVYQNSSFVKRAIYRRQMDDS